MNTKEAPQIAASAINQKRSCTRISYLDKFRFGSRLKAKVSCVLGTFFSYMSEVPSYTAIHAKTLSRDIAGILGEKKRNGFCNF